jgi:hypothetical protein
VCRARRSLYARRVHVLVALVGLGLVVGITGCRPDTTAVAADTAVIEAGPVHAPPASSSSSAAAPATPAVEIADGEPLREGRVVFEGMVVPTKGGHTVRGVVFDGGMLVRAAPSVKAADDLLGARVRVTAEVVRHEEPPPRTDGLAEQRREGTWHQAVSVETATIVTPPVVVEGKLLRSKGLFQLGEHLVTRSDLAWALAPDGAKEGDRVRVWGQPRVYRCAPDEQCLMGGSIPMFDVGRAERLP